MSSSISEDGYAHEVASGFSMLTDSVATAQSILNEHPSSISEADLIDLQDCLNVIDLEVDTQRYEALNLLAYRDDAMAAGILRPLLRHCDPCALLREMLPRYAAAARRWSIEIFEQFTEEFPSILVEESSLRRAFHNVLANALKYSYHSGPATSRYILVNGLRHDADGLRWCIRIQNYGVGILPEERVKVFQPGYRGELARKDNTFGSGLGLSEVKRVLEHHGGNIHIESTWKHAETYLTTVSLVFARHSQIRGHYPNVGIVD